MSNLFVLVVVIALCVGSNNASKVFPKNQMYFRNSFSKNTDVLTVHCKSDKDDLGVHSVKRSYEYSFKFGDNLLGGTQFDCTLMHESVGFRYSRTFTAYKEASYLRFGAIFLWEARDDGIYLTDADHDAKFMYSW